MRIRIILILTIYCSLLLPINYLLAQNALPTGYFSDQYWVEQFNKTHGLPENVVMDINQDAQGIIWITTAYHLVRYDGCDFTSYKPADQFRGEYFHFFPGLEIDPQGTLWSPAKGASVLSFDVKTKKFSKHSYFDNLDLSIKVTDQSFPKLSKTKNGDIWTTSANGMARFKWNKNKYDILEFPSSKFNVLDSLFFKIQALSTVTVIDKVKDFADIKKEIMIDHPGEYLILSMGEAGFALNSAVDYGELIDSKGIVIWSLNNRQTSSAGGDDKNIFAFNKIHLEASIYTLHYVSDDSHSYNAWNASPPARPELWGIRLIPEKNSNNLFQIFHDKFVKLDEADPNGILKLIPLNNNQFIGIKQNGLVKINIPTTSEKRLDIKPMDIVGDFIPGTSYTYLDDSTIYIPGNKLIGQAGIWKPYALIYSISDDLAKVIEIDSTDLAYNSILKDKKGNFWLGDWQNDGGLYLSDQGSSLPHFRKFQILPPSQQGNARSFQQIWDIFEDKDGDIWIATRGQGLYRIRPKKYTSTFYSVPSQNNRVYRDILEDVHGDIWLSHRSANTKFNIHDQSILRWTNTDSLLGPSNLFLDNDLVTLGTKEGLKKWDTIKNTFILEKYPSLDSLFAVDKDDRGRYWYFDYKWQSAFIQNKNDYLPILKDSFSVQTTYIQRSANGEFWIAPSFTGISQYKIADDNLVFVKRFLPPNMDVKTVIDGPDHSLWIGTYDDGLLHLDPNTGNFKAYTTAHGLPSNGVYKLLLLNDLIWVVTDLSTGFFYLKDSSFRSNPKLDALLKPLLNVPDFSSAFFESEWNDRIIKLKNGKLAAIVKNGFIVFDPTEFGIDTLLPGLIIKDFYANQVSIPFDQKNNLSDIRIQNLKHTQNDILIEYQGINYDRNNENQYAFYLKGGNKDWVFSGHERSARFSNLSPGKYVFYLKAANADGIWSDEKQMLSFVIAPPIWRSWWSFIFYLAAGLLSLRYYLNYKNKALKKQNLQLESVVNDRTKELKENIITLQSTQAQLIQSEKMASLGELTAGIAHEIQNPLNFVNNFSEVNTELIDEIIGDRRKKMEERNDKLLDELIGNIKENELKINHHGKRADAIVKNMLQHSRSTVGLKEPTDINALTDEYLRLAYHGLRAKDKTFNASLHTDFDESIGKINLIPQDIGRVLLNLINNAFYAVTEKKKQLGHNFEPTVTISTKKLNNNKVEICIKDNGPGIPPKIVDKIFQPFFTTKPTGQGTGLGLSLAYDIIKAHGGSLLVQSNYSEPGNIELKSQNVSPGGNLELISADGSGTEFIITLPVI